MSANTASLFLDHAFQRSAVRFGDFQIRFQQVSPYAFSSENLVQGDPLSTVSRHFIETIHEHNLNFDMIFGATKVGGRLAEGICDEYAQQGQHVTFAFNDRAKEDLKSLNIQGAPIKGRVLIVNDSLTTGETAQDAINIVKSHGAQPVGVVVAFDRMERGRNRYSPTTAQTLEKKGHIPVVGIASLDDLCDYLDRKPDLREKSSQVREYKHMINHQWALTE